MKKILLITCGFAAMAIFSLGCKKIFLDAKPSSTIVQPKTLDDFQSLLESVYNAASSPALATMSADEYDFINYATFQSTQTATERNAYIWAKDIFGGEINAGDWNGPYTNIFYSNNVLSGLDKLKGTETDITRVNYLRGWALFQRAFAYYDLVDNFSPVYDSLTAATDLGVPIKLNPSVDDVQSRSTVQNTYDQIFSDLNTAMPLLVPNIPPKNRDQPSKVAAHALLARIYLNMRKYDLAELQADSSLQLYSSLIDYNTVSLTSTTPFTQTNDELIFYKSAIAKYPSTITSANSFINIRPSLTGLYNSNDLRRSIYFVARPGGATAIKKQYDGNQTLYPFTGLAVDEVYLIKSECAKVILERQKELVWRNLRWDDIKRLNKEGANITLTRPLNAQTYTLPPNDPRYVFPIPDNEIQLGGIPQNIR